MTKGINKLTLNEATLIEALTYWLEHKVWKQDEMFPSVTGLSVEGHLRDEFVVTLKAHETPAGA